MRIFDSNLYSAERHYVPGIEEHEESSQDLQPGDESAVGDVLLLLLNLRGHLCIGFYV